MNRTLVLAAVALILHLAGALLLLRRESEENVAPATMTAPAAAAPDQGGGPTNSFVVCPGDPRCPKGETEGD